MDDKVGLRARDFWTSLILIALSVAFLWQTSLLPFYDAKAAGVNSAQWFNSAAIVPFGIFGLLLLLAITLLTISIRDGGAARALRSVGINDRVELRRIALLSLILIAYRRFGAARRFCAGKRPDIDRADLWISFRPRRPNGA